ncbi:MAG: aminopeptidase P family protein [Clostridiales bacterium]|nr:aminopeptidase P family protein [Clostridiales bacterium]
MTNLEKIMNGMSDQIFDAILLLSPQNRRYATGLSTSSGAVIIHQAGGSFLTDFRYIEAARKISGFEVLLTNQEKSVYEQLNEIIKKKRIKTLAIEENEMTVASYNKYKDALNANLVYESGFMSELRVIKDESEKSKVQKAVDIADASFYDILPIIRRGMTERDIACELEYRMLKRGAEGMSFDPIVVSGVRSSMPHGTPSDKIIDAGEFLTMDFGCIADGYCSDMTRTVALGYATDEMKNIYELVLQAQLAAIEKAAEGVPAKDVDYAARKRIEQAGFDHCFGHSTGHGVGLNIHEAPTVSVSSKEILKEGNIISAEPGIYIDGKFGVRIEDLLFITKNGCEILSKSSKQLMILD